MVTIREAQNLVYEHLVKIKYTESETSPVHAFLHLVEEVGEVSRAFLHKETNRASFVGSVPGDIEEEVADILWQTLKLASYLRIDLENAFVQRLEENRNKSR